MQSSNLDTSDFSTLPTHRAFIDMRNYDSEHKFINDIGQAKAKETILIVDDDAFNLYALKELILTLGIFEIDTAVNGKDAIDKVLQRQEANKEPFSLIIMDLNMPV